MPIDVSCPSCSGSFKVKDEYAGKRAKCPKCGEPMTIPAADFEMADDEPAPAPARTAKPVAAKKPKPADDEPDEKPRGRKRPADDEGDEKPRAKKNRDDDEDEDDKPRKKGKGGGGPPKKKGSALPLILGIVGGVLLVCGGGCAGVWFLVIKPTADQVNAGITKYQQEWENANVTVANTQRVKAGMTATEVDGVFNAPGREPIKMEMSAMVMSMPGDPPAVTEKWEAALAQNRVRTWAGGKDKVAVAYSSPPSQGGKVVGVLGMFGSNTKEYVTLPESAATPPVGPGPGPTPQPSPSEGKATSENTYKLFRGNTYAEVEKKLGKGRVADVATVKADAAKLTVSDDVKKRWEERAKLGHVMRYDNGADRVLCTFSESAELNGTLDAVLTTFGGSTSNIFDPTPVAEVITISAAELAAEYDRDERAAKEKFRGKTLKLSGKVTEVTKYADLMLEGVKVGKGNRPVVVKVGLHPDLKKAAELVKPGDTVTVTCAGPSFLSGFGSEPGQVSIILARFVK